MAGGAHGSHDVEEVGSNPEVEGNLEAEDTLVGDNLEVEFQAYIYGGSQNKQ